MVDHLHGDLAGVGSVEGAALVGVQFRPSGFIHFGLKCVKCADERNHNPDRKGE